MYNCGFKYIILQLQLRCCSFLTWPLVQYAMLRYQPVLKRYLQSNRPFIGRILCNVALAIHVIRHNEPVNAGRNPQLVVASRQRDVCLSGKQDKEPAAQHNPTDTVASSYIG